MKKPPKGSTDSFALRVAAEKILQAKKKGPRRTGSQIITDAKKNFHELQVNQIELEMQNAALMELQQARAEIVARYTDLYTFAPIGFLTLDQLGTMIEVNLEAAGILGLARGQLIGERIGRFIPYQYLADFQRFLAGIFDQSVDQSSAQSYEMYITNVQGSELFVRIEANADRAGQVCRVVLEDISARKFAEQALVEAKEDLERRVLERTWQMENANALLRLEIDDHKQTVATLRDSEAALRQLVAHQESVREEERKRLARELHDDLGGLLGGISVNTSVAIKRMKAVGLPVDPLLDEILEQADSAFGTVRAVIADLRPGVLDQLGLWAAVEWYASKLQKQTGVKFKCIFDEFIEDLDLDSERSIAVFRIVQEALNNVVRHAQASCATVRAWVHDDVVLVEVEDDGCGIAERRSTKRACWGLVGMDERARHFGGDLITGPAQSMQKRRGHERRNPVRAGPDRRCNTRGTRPGTRVQLRLPIEDHNAGKEY